MSIQKHSEEFRSNQERSGATRSDQKHSEESVKYT